jgi:hypothetical protein
VLSPEFEKKDLLKTQDNMGNMATLTENDD